MSKGVVLHLDSDQKIFEHCNNIFLQKIENLEYIFHDNQEAFKRSINDHLKSGNLKFLIFDLVGNNPGQKELEIGDAKFLDEIRESFKDLNIPIFIYSGSIHLIEDQFVNNGTVYKIDKQISFEEVLDKIILFNDSGFVDVFCPGGILESEIFNELNKSFTTQFLRNEEIENVISKIKGQNSLSESSDRIKRVFKRIALRTLLTELLLPEIDEEGKLIEEKVSSVEHYIRRIGSIPICTGDLFKSKEDDNFIFILTPRCNVLRSDSVLVCPFIWKDIIIKKDRIEKMLQGDPTVSGYDGHLPPSPIFEGGKLALSKYYILEKTELLKNYELHISLSDELTNEIIGKFGAHFFRTGITPWDSNEI